MAYDVNKMVKLGALKALAQKVEATHAKKATVAALTERVNGLDDAALRGVKVNGVALAIAEKMVDILIATGSADGTISVNGADVAVKGLAALAFKTEVSEDELSVALKAVIDAKAEKTAVEDLNTTVTTLIGEDAGKSARTIANEELAKQLIPENAQESLDTLAEIAAWIQEHPEDATAMNTAITNLTNLVGTLPEGATSTTVVDYIAEAIAAIGIGDYAKTAWVTEQLKGYVVAEEGKRLMTDAEGTKLEGITEGATKVEASETNGNVKINGVETPVYTLPAEVVKSNDIATDAEVEEMLAEVFAEESAE